MSNKEKHTFSSGSKKKDFLNLHSDLVAANRAILIHDGTKPHHTEGCLLANGKDKIDEISPAGTQSKTAKIDNIRSFATEYLGVVLKNYKKKLSLTVIIKNEFEN